MVWQLGHQICLVVPGLEHQLFGGSRNLRQSSRTHRISNNYLSKLTFSVWNMIIASRRRKYMLFLGLAVGRVWSILQKENDKTKRKWAIKWLRLRQWRSLLSLGGCLTTIDSCITTRSKSSIIVRTGSGRGQKNMCFYDSNLGSRHFLKCPYATQHL